MNSFSLIIRLKIFLSLLSLGKCLDTRARKRCPMLVLTFLLNGGLYQRMSFRRLFFFCSVSLPHRIMCTDNRYHEGSSDMEELLYQNMLCWMTGMKGVC